MNKNKKSEFVVKNTSRWIFLICLFERGSYWPSGIHYVEEDGFELRDPLVCAYRVSG